MAASDAVGVGVAAEEGGGGARQRRRVRHRRRADAAGSCVRDGVELEVRERGGSG